MTVIDCGVSRTVSGSLPIVGVCGLAADSPLTVTAGSVAASPAACASAGPAAVNASQTGQ